MPKVRAGFKGKYALSKHEFYVAYHYALQYKEWIRERMAIESSQLQGMKYDTDKVQTSGGVDQMPDIAERAIRLDKQIQTIVSAAKEADEDLVAWILAGAIEEGMTFYKLQQKGIPCGKKMYYDRRRKFYYLLSKKILKEG